jgi:xanthine dehydrogenase molybdenum-binding subunit
MTDLAVVGRPAPFREARAKVTGRARYVDDLKTDLWVRFLGSPHPHARIRSIDTCHAESLDGVRAVLTHERMPDRRIFFAVHRQSRVMDSHLRHVGDYVAAVAAVDEATAEAALDLIQVEYEPLPAVFDPEEALRPDAPRVYPEGNDYAVADLPPGEGTPDGVLQEWGDPALGFEQADVVVEESYDIRSQVHSAIEPHVCMARWEGDELTVWAATQTPTELRVLLADYFEVPQSRVVVHSEHVGGGFGGKTTGRYHFIPCLLARMAPGRKVKLRLTREESQCDGRRTRGKLVARIGATRDGALTAIHLKALFDIGAYGDHHTGSNSFHYEGGVLSYNVPSARFEAVDVHTNHFRAACMRSVHVPYVAFAIESTIDLLAEQLGLDPVAIRMKNMPGSGDEMPPGGYRKNTGLYPNGRFDIYPARELLEQVIERIDWRSKWKGWGQPNAIDGPRRRGIGLVYCMEYGGYWMESGTNARVDINSDGSAVVYAAAQEIGQGTNTALCMLVAESLGLPLADVSIVAGDSRSGTFDYVAAQASHQLATVGHAVLQAVEDAKRQIREQAAPRWEAHPDQVEVLGRMVWLRDSPETAFPLHLLFGPLDDRIAEQFIPGVTKTTEGILWRLRPPVVGTAAGAKEGITPLIDGQLKPHQPVVLAAEVEVDIETGIVRPLKLVTGTFPGRMINPAGVRGQALGGATQSLGMALWEELRYDEAAACYLSDGFTNYRIPRALDVPEIDTVFLEQVDAGHQPHEGLPYGARGAGEMTAWGAVVIASAINNALGVRLRNSPMTPEVVLNALEERAV